MITHVNRFSGMTALSNTGDSQSLVLSDTT